MCERETIKMNHYPFSFFFFLFIGVYYFIICYKEKTPCETQLTSLNKIYYIYIMLHTTSSHMSVFLSNVESTPV